MTDTAKQATPETVCEHCGNSIWLLEEGPDRPAMWLHKGGYGARCPMLATPRTQPQGDAPRSAKEQRATYLGHRNGLPQFSYETVSCERCAVLEAALTQARKHLDKIINAPNPLGAPASTYYSVIEQIRSCARDADAALAATKEPATAGVRRARRERPSLRSVT